MNLESLREHEIAFFKDLGNIDMFREEIMGTPDMFNYFAEGHITIKREELKNLDREILDYLYFHTAPNTRKAYLNRLIDTSNSIQADLQRSKENIIGNSDTVRLKPLHPNIFEHNIPSKQIESFFDACIELSNELKETLQKYINAEEDHTPTLESTIFEGKFPWTGTPQEFGAIFLKLIEQGYIPITKDLKHTVNLLQNHFQMFDSTGKEVTAKNLYKCFYERPKKYYPEEFKLIKSDNYGKTQ